MSELLSNISTEKKIIQPSYNNQSQENLQHSNKMKLTRTQYLLVTIHFQLVLHYTRKRCSKFIKKSNCISCQTLTQIMLQINIKCFIHEHNDVRTYIHTNIIDEATADIRVKLRSWSLPGAAS